MDHDFHRVPVVPKTPKANHNPFTFRRTASVGEIHTKNPETPTVKGFYKKYTDEKQNFDTKLVAPPLIKDNWFDNEFCHHVIQSKPPQILAGAHIEEDAGSWLEYDDEDSDLTYSHLQGFEYKSWSKLCALVAKMRNSFYNEKGRNWSSNRVIRNSFSGAELVDWLLRHGGESWGIKTRSQASLLANNLLSIGFIVRHKPLPMNSPSLYAHAISKSLPRIPSLRSITDNNKKEIQQHSQSSKNLNSLNRIGLDEKKSKSVDVNNLFHVVDHITIDRLSTIEHHNNTLPQSFSISSLPTLSETQSHFPFFSDSMSYYVFQEHPPIVVLNGPISNITKIDSLHTPSVYTQMSHKYNDDSNNKISRNSHLKSSIAIELSVSALHKAVDLFTFQTDTSGKQSFVDCREIPSLKTKLFSQFVSDLRRLQSISLDNLSLYQRLAFFINIYHCLMLHGLMIWPFGGSLNDVQARLRCARHCTYIIAGYAYSCLDIKFGILRGDMPFPSNDFNGLYLFPPRFTPTDPRKEYCVHTKDPRINFVLCNFSKDSPILHVFHPHTIDISLSQATRLFLRKHLKLELLTQSFGKTLLKVIVSEVLEWYKSDFGNSREAVVQWLASFHWDHIVRSQICDFLHARSIILEFIPHTWSLSMDTIQIHSLPQSPEPQPHSPHYNQNQQHRDQKHGIHNHNKFHNMGGHNTNHHEPGMKTIIFKNNYARTHLHKQINRVTHESNPVNPVNSITVNTNKIIGPQTIPTPPKIISPLIGPQSTLKSKSLNIQLASNLTDTTVHPIIRPEKIMDDLGTKTKSKIDISPLMHP